MTPEQTADFELIKKALVFTKRVDERGWVVLRTEYNGRWLEGILMGDDKHTESAQAKSMDSAALTIWMKERIQCPACEKFHDINVIATNWCKCRLCQHEFLVWLEDEIY